MNPALRLLLSNKSWAQEKVAIDPKYFARFARVQQPEFLWVSCSDSRVLANELTATDPGELFVHRNIANLVHPDDVNCLSVVQYAVEVLGVSHVIVCGHYGCGGVQAALNLQATGHLDRWLRPIRDLCVWHRDELDALADAPRWDRLVELNAIHQIETLAQTPEIRGAWARWGRPFLHAWVYSLHDGLLRPLQTLTPRGGPISFGPSSGGSGLFRLGT